MNPEKKSLPLIRRIYEAALDPSAWQAFVEELSDVYHGASVGFALQLPGFPRPEGALYAVGGFKPEYRAIFAEHVRYPRATLGPAYALYGTVRPGCDPAFCNSFIEAVAAGERADHCLRYASICHLDDLAARRPIEVLRQPLFQLPNANFHVHTLPP